jgi:hypothetical protein
MSPTRSVRNMFAAELDWVGAESGDLHSLRYPKIGKVLLTGLSRTHSAVTSCQQMKKPTVETVGLIESIFQSAYGDFSRKNTFD